MGDLFQYYYDYESTYGASHMFHRNNRPVRHDFQGRPAAAAPTPVTRRAPSIVGRGDTPSSYRVPSGPPFFQRQDGLVKLLLPFKHLNHTSYPRLPDIGAFRALEPEHNRIDVGLVQGPEESQGALVLVEFTFEVCRHYGLALWAVRSVPPAVSLCLLYLLEPGGLHPPSLD